MTEILLDKIKEHIRANLISYILLFLFFAVGIFLGGYVAKSYKTEDVNFLKDFFDESVSLFTNEPPDYNKVFKNTFLLSVKTIGFIWLLGFTVIGLPIVFFMNLKTGFMMGFVSTFVISFYSYKGILIALSLIFTQCLIYIPCVFVISSHAISLSGMLGKMLFGKMRYKINLKYYLLTYIMVLAVALLVLILYSLSEAYLSSNLLDMIFKSLVR